MPLSMYHPILAREINEITCYVDRKVFCLRAFDGSELVIKIDDVNKEQLKATTIAIKNIDHVARMKLLTADEIFQLEQYCKSVLDMDLLYLDLVPVDWKPDSQSDAAEMLRVGLGFQAEGMTVAKMCKQTVHDLNDAAQKRGTGSKELIRMFVAAMKADDGLEGLGRVVAADLFNNNNDRFSPKGGHFRRIGAIGFDLRCLVNPKNVMLVTENNRSRVSALDYVYGKAEIRDLDAALNMTETANNPWPGRLLIDQAARRSYAQDIVHDLEEIFNPKKAKFGSSTKLGSNAAARVDAGMVEGARRIRAGLAQRANNKINGLPPGLQDRYTILLGLRA